MLNSATIERRNYCYITFPWLNFQISEELKYTYISAPLCFEATVRDIKGVCWGLLTLLFVLCLLFCLFRLSRCFLAQLSGQCVVNSRLLELFSFCFVILVTHRNCLGPLWIPGLLLFSVSGNAAVCVCVCVLHAYSAQCFLWSSCIVSWISYANLCELQDDGKTIGLWSEDLRLCVNI